MKLQECGRRILKKLHQSRSIFKKKRNNPYLCCKIYGVYQFYMVSYGESPFLGFNFRIFIDLTNRFSCELSYYKTNIWRTHIAFENNHWVPLCILINYFNMKYVHLTLKTESNAVCVEFFFSINSSIPLSKIIICYN